MKTTKISISLAVLMFSLGSSANAEIIDTAGGGELVVSINNLDSGLSLLIDLDVLTSDVINGSFHEYQSSQNLTDTISDFLAGADATVWVAAGYRPGFSTNYALSTSDKILNASDVSSYLDDYDQFVAAANDAGLGGSPWVPQVTGSLGGLGSWFDPVAMDTSTAFALDASGIAGFSSETLGYWQLSTSGELTYSAVPLPAPLWLFGSAMMGWVAIRRKR